MVLDATSRSVSSSTSPKTLRTVVIAVWIALLYVSPGHAQSFHGIESLSASSQSGTTAISADGSVIVGYSIDPGTRQRQAVRWTRSGGTQGLGFLSGLTNFSLPYGTSTDGSTILGVSESSTQTQGFRWTSPGGMVGLGLDAGETGNIARAASGDGSIIVGTSASLATGAQAFRWTSGGGKVKLGLLSGFDVSSATAVSGDGSVVAGTALDTVTFAERAFRWTAAAGIAGLDIPGGYASTTARSISQDGSTIVGSAIGSDGKAQAFRWTAASGSQLLGFLSGDFASEANGVSGDGSVVVGASMGLTGTIYAKKAARWTPSKGVQSIETILQSAGVNLGGFRLLNATAVSADGTYIAGIGNQSGTLKGWVAHIPLATPETTIVAAVLPTARTTTFGVAVTGFATIINTGSVTAKACSIDLPVLSNGVTSIFLYQTTDPATNQPVGAPNAPADVAPGGSQSFYFAITLNGPSFISSYTQDMALNFECSNTARAQTIFGVDTFLVTASQTPLPDLVSIASTPTHDGILTLPGTTGAGAFATAAINIGAGATVTCSAGPNPAGFTNRTLAATLSICQSDAQGQCTNPPTPGTSSTVSVANNQTVTFSIFAQGQGQTIPFDPANNRIFFACKQGSTTAGEASVAVRTQ